jgi:hypothetical protein
MFTNELVQLAYALIIFSGFATVAITIYVIVKISAEIYWYIEGKFLNAGIIRRNSIY